MIDAPQDTTPHPSPSPREGRGSKGKDLRTVKMGRLFAEAKKRGISSEQLRNEIAPGQIGKRLSKASIVELERLTQYLGADPSRSRYDKPLMSGFKNRYDELGNRPGMATPAQLRKIEAMWSGVSTMNNPTARERALEGFLKRIVGVVQMEWIESWMVQKLIKAIEGMKRRA